jgi:hypothetical protein
MPSVKCGNCGLVNFKTEVVCADEKFLNALPQWSDRFERLY